MLQFKIGSIPIAIQPIFWLLALLLGFGAYTGTDLVVWIAVVLVSVLLHELGHAFTARGFGMHPNVVLHGFGGVTTFIPKADLRPWKRIMITLNGPFAGFALAGVAWLVLNQTEWTDPGTGLRLALGLTIWVNMLWGVLNLVPIRGLDGGHALEGLFEWAIPKYSTPIMEVLYVVFGAAAVVLGFLNGYILLAIFAIYMTVAPWIERRRRRTGAKAEPDRVTVDPRALLDLFGMEPTQFEHELRERSLADLASARGVGLAEVTDLFMPQIQEQIDGAVESGAISPTEAEIRLVRARRSVEQSLHKVQEPQRRQGPRLGI